MYYAGNGEYTGTGVYDTMPPTVAVRDRKITIKPGTNTEEFKHVSLLGPNFRLTDIPLNKVRDIAYDEIKNLIWLATNASGDPIRSFNAQSQVVSTIPSSIGIGSNICGLTMAHIDGNRFLWASDLSTNKIYKIDLDGATYVDNTLDAHPMDAITCFSDTRLKRIIIECKNVSHSENQMSFSVYSMQGEKLFYKQFNGRYIWDGAYSRGRLLPRGVYAIKVIANHIEKNVILHKLW